MAAARRWDRQPIDAGSNGRYWPQIEGCKAPPSQRWGRDQVLV